MAETANISDLHAIKLFPSISPLTPMLHFYKIRLFIDIRLCTMALVDQRFLWVADGLPCSGYEGRRRETQISVVKTIDGPVVDGHDSDQP
nr:hypothetical protein [Tanacetum cinerariifolium]